ncbi:unnamed protein product [Musa acuminata subsp. malaccensis]|uniref:(wild Malaysian banana) hypothetical protein n=1 Tax=Musa acuminata subsp. malaccensis TaxID=214687 RepID=A0A804JKX9_MUSAM|nr:unnamed protein product [Musa acuminata subsp. malaccensis]
MLGSKPFLVDVPPKNVRWFLNLYFYPLAANICLRISLRLSTRIGSKILAYEKNA